MSERDDWVPGMEEIFEPDDPEGDESWSKSGVTKRQFFEFSMAVMHAFKTDQISDKHCLVLLLWSLEEEAHCTEVDLLPGLREALYDWPQENLDQIVECAIVQMHMPVPEDRPCKAGHNEHLAQVIRLRTSGLDWHAVPSRINFEEAISNLASAHLPRDKDGNIDTNLMLASNTPSLQASFQKAMQQDVEAEVGKFRNELDALFPSTPEGGDHDANPGP